MSENDRLRQARLAAGFPSGAAAARALGMPPPTYAHYEDGRTKLGAKAATFARKFKVRVEWLLTGAGDMRGKAAAIPIRGVVGAGAAVAMVDDAAVDPHGEFVMPEPGRVEALIVKGESQWPRFLDGEIVLFDPVPVLPETLIGRYAIVQTTDGRRLIKTLRRGRGANKWRLESHNAPPEDDVELLGAWRYLGTLDRR